MAYRLTDRYKFLVIDEAHERGLNSDILLYFQCKIGD